MQGEFSYVDERLNRQAKWYEGKANTNKSKFHTLQVVIIAASAIIPIINLMDFAPFETRLISSLLGGGITAITAVIQLKKYQENWLLYRATEENLKKERYLFEYGAGPYSDVEDQKRLLVERVESIISAETSKYFGMHQPRSLGGQSKEV
jgi:hypothetical protein